MTAQILTQARLRELLDYDPKTGGFTWRIRRNQLALKGSKAGTPDSHGHIQIGVDGKFYLAHRLVWMHVYGLWPNLDVDHINGIKSDNRIENLRDISTAMNCQNELKARSNSQTKLLGTHRVRYGYIAQICVNGKKRYIGLFKTAEEAHTAYIRAKRELHPGNML